MPRSERSAADGAPRSPLVSTAIVAGVGLDIDSRARDDLRRRVRTPLRDEWTVDGRGLLGHQGFSERGLEVVRLGIDHPVRRLDGGERVVR